MTDYFKHKNNNVFNLNLEIEYVENELSNIPSWDYYGDGTLNIGV